MHDLGESNDSGTVLLFGHITMTHQIERVKGSALLLQELTLTVCRDVLLSISL